MYDGERVDGRVLDQLETILRHVADELAAWRARALKAEGDLKELSARASTGGGGAAGGGAGPGWKADPESRNRIAELEQENRALRQRVEAARVRVHDLLARLTFLEEQAREGGSGGGGNGGGRIPGAAGGASEANPGGEGGGATGAGGRDSAGGGERAQ